MKRLVIIFLGLSFLNISSVYALPDFKLVNGILNNGTLHMSREKTYSTTTGETLIGNDHLHINYKLVKSDNTVIITAFDPNSTNNIQVDGYYIISTSATSTKEEDTSGENAVGANDTSYAATENGYIITDTS